MRPVLNRATNTMHMSVLGDSTRHLACNSHVDDELRTVRYYFTTRYDDSVNLCDRCYQSTRAAEEWPRFVQKFAGLT